jgi:hypothetical protein
MKLKYLIVFFLLLSTRVWAIGDTKVEKIYGSSFMVSPGRHHTCALDAEGVKCWGFGSNGQTNMLGLALKSPIQVSAGWAHTCALDAEGVKCWGFGSEMPIPSLKSPVQVSAGYWHTCALDAEGVKCWGTNHAGQLIVPALKSPTQVSAGYHHTCALDADGVKCWGNIGEAIVPALKLPTQVSVGADHTCVLDADGVKCWGLNKYGQTKVPTLKSPTQVSAGGNSTCALDAEGVKCWGDGQFGQTTVPYLNRPIQVSVGYNHACALDTDGVKCWGNNNSHELNAPAILFDLAGSAVPFVTAARAEYLEPSANFNVGVKSKAYYLKCLLISPAILSNDSTYFLEKFLPKFQKTIEWLQQAFSFGGDIREIPDAEEHRKLAIMSIQSALSVSLSFTATDEQASIQDVIRAAGGALAEPMNSQKIKDLVLQIDALSAGKQKLKSSSKSAFLVDSLELAANWLREKVK